jgi:hypothetical protein
MHKTANTNTIAVCGALQWDCKSWRSLELQFSRDLQYPYCREISTTTLWRWLHDNECSHDIVRVAHTMYQSNIITFRDLSIQIRVYYEIVIFFLPSSNADVDNMSWECKAGRKMSSQCCIGTVCRVSAPWDVLNSFTFRLTLTLTSKAK